MNGELHKLELKSGDKILIYGIGNLGRQDDGLGVRLIEKLEAADLPSQITLESNYQLNVEDALLMSEFDVVLFADASKDSTGAEPYSVRAIRPAAELSFSSHAMGFAGVLALCEQLYGRKPRTFLVAIPGYEWDISESLSEKASRNLDQTFDSLRGEALCMRSR